MVAWDRENHALPHLFREDRRAYLSIVQARTNPLAGSVTGKTAMTLINCPQCQQKVMSVASVCPKCGFSFSEQRKKDAHSTRAKLCKNCHREIAPNAQLCPHCGEVGPVRRPVRWLLPAGMVIVLAVAIFLIPLAGGEESDDPAQLTTPEEQPPAQVEMAAPTQPAPVSPDSLPVTPPAVQAEVALPPADTTQVTLTRWTSNWVNVRAARDPDAEIVRVLTPGQEVEVGDLDQGWWAVYLEGETVGFVAASLILDQPPGSEPDTAVPAFRLP